MLPNLNSSKSLFLNKLYPKYYYIKLKIFHPRQLIYIDIITEYFLNTQIVRYAKTPLPEKSNNRIFFIRKKMFLFYFSFLLFIYAYNSKIFKLFNQFACGYEYEFLMKVSINKRENVDTRMEMRT